MPNLLSRNPFHGHHNDHHHDRENSSNNPPQLIRSSKSFLNFIGRKQSNDSTKKREIYRFHEIYHNHYKLYYNKP